MRKQCGGSLLYPDAGCLDTQAGNRIKVRHSNSHQQFPTHQARTRENIQSNKTLIILSNILHCSGIRININSRILRTFVRLYKQLLSYHKPTRTNRMTFFHDLCGYFSSRTASAKIWPYPAHFSSLRKAKKIIKKSNKYQRAKSHSTALSAVATRSWHKLCKRSIYTNNKLLIHSLPLNKGLYSDICVYKRSISRPSPFHLTTHK